MDPIIKMMNFEDISCEKSKEKLFLIYFAVDGCDYFLKIKNGLPKSMTHWSKEDMFSGRALYSEFPIELTNCDLCGVRSTMLTGCEFLEKYIKDVFERLKEDSTVRLRLLF